MKPIITLLSILFTSVQLFAQAAPCGTEQTKASVDQLKASKALFQKLDITQTEDSKYVPVKFHLIADSVGNGRVKEYDILNQLCILNEDFSNTDFQFYLKDADFSYFNSTAIFEDSRTSTLAKNQMLTLKDAHAINVFVVNTTSSNTQGSNISYFDPNNDWIVLVKKESEDGTNQLSHQIGHFFSLLHTYFGWPLIGGFDSSYPNWPIAPVNDPTGGLTENQDGSNCTIAGDLLCDTPPDYGFGGLDFSCNYTGGAKDPKGILVDPLENNQMGSFALSECYPYTFTPDQINAMYGDYAKSSRDYIRQSSYVPNTTQVTEPATLVWPGNNENLASNIGVTLDWNDVPNAEYYLLEVSRSLNFSSLTQNYIVTESQKELPELTANKKYYWKVTPFNDGASCMNGLTSPKWKFKASPLATSNIKEINAWDVIPNPTTASTLKFAIELDKALEITAQLVAVNGQVLSTKDLKVNTGKQVISMPNTKLSNGTYFLRLISKNGMETRRVVIQN